MATFQSSKKQNFLAYTQSQFGTLYYNLGCFPFEHRPYRQHSDYEEQRTIFGVCFLHSFLRKKTVFSGSTLARLYYYTLYLNIFHGKQAISWFDWHFTATHKSSYDLATSISSILHDFLRRFNLFTGSSPGFVSIHSDYNRSFKLAFATAS